VLGKPTTLMQCSCSTVEWHEFHARRLVKTAARLEEEAAKFKMIPRPMHALLTKVGAYFGVRMRARGGLRV
jgi:hypothetical protein